MPRRQAPAGKPRGVATVFITMVLLLAVGMIALYTSRSAIIEQRLSANDVRAKQALAAANSGLDLALAHMRNGGIYQNDLVVEVPPVYTIDTFAVTQLVTQLPSGGAPSYYHVVYIDPAVPIPNCPATRGVVPAPATSASKLSEVVVVSCGWSDDDAAVQRVVERFAPVPVTAGTISTPLVTRGVSDFLTGGASVLNYFNDLTVWSGGSMLGQSNTGKTFIRDVVAHPTANPAFDFRDTGNSPGCNNPPAGYTCSTQGSVLGHDTVGGDTNLSSKTVPEFFEYFMGATQDDYRDLVATWVVDVAGTLTNENSTNINSISGMTDRVVWVEGNASLPSMGSIEKPVILVVNGNLTMSANAVVYGMVFVTGNITGNGSPTIYGSLIGGGTANVTGNPKVIYDPNVLGATAALGKAAKVPGTWRDW